MSNATLDEHGGGTLEEYMSDVMAGNTSEAFYYYEPFDTPEEDRDPGTHGFQIGYHAAVESLRLTVAGNRLGKTQQMGIEAVIMMTGEVPYSMQYPEGTVTSYPRPWKNDGQDSPGMLNRMRWGFLDPETDEWIPPVKEPGMARPEDRTAENPCGFIVGVGVFPDRKISRRYRDSVWVCTYKAVRDERWIKFLSSIIPKQFLDTRWSENGYSEKAQKFRLLNGNEITFITYEQGPERAQGANVFACFLDEEPKQRKFYTECDQRLISAGFEGFMSMCFTPLLGLSWSYSDLYQPGLRGENRNIKIFHAGQPDSPYIAPETIERRRKTYKAWEVEARIHGRFSETAGRPYYDYEKLTGTVHDPGWIKRFIPRRQLYFLRPTMEYDRLEELLGTDITREPACPADSPHEGWWEFYEEEVLRDGSYWIAGDTAQGAEDEEDAQDRSTAYVLRLPLEGEDPDWPVLVAAMRTALPTLSFAREVWYAAMYFNYALIAPEVHGETGAVLATEIRDWPFFYYSTVINDKTHKPVKRWGFEMSKKTRTPLFDGVGDFINSHDNPQCMRHEALVRECAELIYGRNGRPDHPKRGTSDCVVGFGVGLYIWRNARHQISNNRAFKEDFAKRHRDRPQNPDDRPFANYLRDERPTGRTASLGAKGAMRRGNRMNNNWNLIGG